MIETNKYQNGKIYKITDIGYTKCYIGSTCQDLCQRMAQHRTNYKYYLNAKYANNSSFLLFDEFGIDNCKIELIEEYACNSKEELNKREGHYIKRLKCVNRKIAGRDDAEYRQDNKETKHNHSIFYYQMNKERLSEIIVCSCGCTSNQKNLARHMKTKKHIQLISQQQSNH